MLNDRKITITVGSSRKALKWLPHESIWSELVEKLRTPFRGTETFLQYMSYPKAKQDDLKDVGGYVAGTLSGERRLGNAVLGRDAITLDLDNIVSGKTNEILKSLIGLGCGYCVYSTRKHCRAAPRLRVLIPLDRTCSADEYEPLARKMAEFIGLPMCDPTTFEVSRMMYFPSCSADGEFIFQFGDAPFVSVDGILKLYHDWRDVSSWKGVLTPKISKGAKQADPTEKSGLVGAFCKVYDIYKAMSELIPDVYSPCDIEGRYTFSGGSTTGGAVVYDGGTFLFSHHATDPAGGKLCNAFDLVRLHKFGELDADANPGTPQNRLPSYTAMCQFVTEDKAAASILNKERYDKTSAAFAAPTGDNEDWMSLLTVSSTTGLPAKTIDNVLIILENDPLLKGKLIYDEFSNRVLIPGELPWDDRKIRRNWVDNDDAGLRHYLERTQRLCCEKKIEDACSLCCHRHTVNVVKEFLTTLPPWDLTPRLDTLLTDYLGAADNIYTRAVSRKSFTAAVARAMTPGVKFDILTVLVGPQGLGKSTFLSILGGEWFSDSLTTFTGKDAYEMIQGVWINEIGELNGFSKAENGQVKQFLSKKEDIFRVPFCKRTEQFPRRCVFFGTTNEGEFLKDKTGGRRFWPVDCGVNAPAKSVFKDLNLERDQIWAEAFLAWQMGEFLDLEAGVKVISKEIQESHEESSVKEGVIADFVAREIPDGWEKLGVSHRKMYWSGEFQSGSKELKTHKRDKICALEVWCEALDGDIKGLKRSDTFEINGILSRLEGWNKSPTAMRTGRDYGVQKGYFRA